MIYDAFHFNDELDLLDIRLHHHTFVDKFILIESTKTYSGLDKPLHYELNKARFAEFSDRIYHIIVDFPFNGNQGWGYEHLQRNILRGFSFETDDVILYTDADEIISGLDAVRAFSTSYHDILSLQMDLCFFYVNLRVKLVAKTIPGYHLDPYFKGKWHMGKILRPSMLSTVHNLYELRQWKIATPDLITNAGWHFSNLGDSARNYKRLKSISHCDDLEFSDLSVEKLEARKKALADPLGRDGVVFEQFDDLPEYLLSHKQQYEQYFLS